MIICGDSLEELRKLDDCSIDSVITDPPYGISFMGKKWDYDIPSIEVFTETLRVLKPGGYILCACGTSTQHRVAVNIEDAGFEIRDIVAWVYGSGFPKSHNIGKAVDKIQGNEREDMGVKTSASYPDSDGVAIYKNRKKSEGTQVGTGGMPRQTKGTSPYEGWGTALKPAMELWTLARKPFKGTVASNVLEHGTGGLNIDGCRVGTDKHVINGGGEGTGWGKKEQINEERTGRFPANLIHDGSDEVVEGFPETVKSTVHNRGKRPLSPAEVGSRDYKYTGEMVRGIADSGSASRFFYCAKASKAERNKGLEGFATKEMTDYGSIKKSEGRTGVNTPQSNFHPTVKPVKLMQYLVRLITPKGGTVLDPYTGSGTTGIACKKEHFEFIGIEKEEEYVEIAKARIKCLGFNQ